ncbi:hypothetical protein BD413DRAFT_493239 [Trametes elegans]|nr:hypothetical protein BD413DRAFT_493239 [Trametes elegans]
MRFSQPYEHSMLSEPDTRSSSPDTRSEHPDAPAEADRMRGPAAADVGGLEMAVDAGPERDSDMNGLDSETVRSRASGCAWIVVRLANPAIRHALPPYFRESRASRPNIRQFIPKIFADH